MRGEPIRIGLVGLGAFGELHCRTLAQMPDVRLVAVASRSASRRAEIADRYGVPHAFADVAGLLDGAAVDAVVVASASEHHAEHVRAALGAGKHVLVEKPFTTEIDSARRLAEEALAAGLHLQVGFLSRYDTRLRRIADAVRAGDLGPVAMMLFTRSVSRDVASSGAYADPITETMSHDVDLALWFGRERVTRVHAATHHALALDRPDGGSAQLVLASGASVLLQADWLLPRAAPRNIRDGHRSLMATCTVIGAHGRAQARLMGDDLSIWTAEPALHPITGRWDTAVGSVEGALERQARAFVRAARGDAPPEAAADLRDAVHGQEVCAAIARSAALGTGVEL